MRRLIFSFLVASVCAAAAAAQSAAVPIDKEPHHKRLLYTNDVRLWDVTLPPGQSTPPFVHDFDVATVVIGDGMLNVQRNGEPFTPPAPAGVARSSSPSTRGSRRRTASKTTALRNTGRSRSRTCTT
jgi:hypothetical protein